MSINTKEIIIKHTGEVVVRNITDSVCEVPETFLEGLTVQRPFIIPWFGHMSSLGLPEQYHGMFGHVGLYISNKQFCICTRVVRMRFNAPVRVLDDQTVTPEFNQKEGLCAQFNWEAPETMQLYFINAMLMEDNMTPRFNKCYLVAVHNGTTYRLPTSNVYDDCAVCMGEFRPGTLGAWDIHIKCLEQFVNSPWNSDLYIGKGGEKSHLLFRFKPKDKGEGFDQIPVTGWVATCAKVSLNVLNEMKGLYV